MRKAPSRHFMACCGVLLCCSYQGYRKVAQEEKSRLGVSLRFGALGYLWGTMGADFEPQHWGLGGEMGSCHTRLLCFRGWLQQGLNLPSMWLL